MFKMETLKSIFKFRSKKEKDMIFSDRNVYRYKNLDLLRIKSLYEITHYKHIIDVISVEWTQYMQLPSRSVNDFIYRSPLLILKSLYDNLTSNKDSLHFISKFIADYMGFTPNFTFYNFE